MRLSQIDLGQIREIFFPHYASLPQIHGWNDIGQESHGVIGWQEREADEIPENDEHEKVIQMRFLLLGFHVQFVHGHSVHELPYGLQAGSQIQNQEFQEFSGLHFSIPICTNL